MSVLGKLLAQGSSYRSQTTGHHAAGHYSSQGPDKENKASKDEMNAFQVRKSS